MKRRLMAFGALIGLGLGLGYLAYSQGVPVPCVPQLVPCEDTDEDCRGDYCQRHECQYGIGEWRDYPTGIPGTSAVGCCNSTYKNYCCNIRKFMVKCKESRPGEPKKVCPNEVVFLLDCDSDGLRHWTCPRATHPCQP